MRIPRSQGSYNRQQMCGRYRLSRRAEILASRFYAEYEGLDWEARYNIAPTQTVPVIQQDPCEPVRRASLMRWGLVPNWAKDATIGARMINARSETAAEKPAFRELLQRRRCVIPTDAFYEQKLANAGWNAAASMVMFAARVATGMTAPARVPTAKMIPAVEALRSMASAAVEAFRPVAAAKRMEAAGARLLARRLRESPVSKLGGRPPSEIRAGKPCRGSAIGASRPVYRRRYVVVSQLRSASVARTLVTAAGVLR
jgi:hypothetical protein